MVLRIVFCWSDISGYMVACWRALHELSEVELFVLAFQARTETAFADQLMGEIPCHLLNLQERNDVALIEQLVVTQAPDVVVLGGWFHTPYRQLTSAAGLEKVAFVMGMDTQWRGDLRQRVAPLILRSFLQRIKLVVVTGERSWQYARYLGVPSVRIMRGLYGIDYNQWSRVWKERQQDAWPRQFLFVGRYIEAKGIDVLFAAYLEYRTRVPDPWPLVCCGQGPLAERLKGQTGIEDRGFVQPTNLQNIWKSAGAFILPSRFEPWGVALVEAAAAGLPVICTFACGSAVEIVRDGYNGLVVPENDPFALAGAMVELHQRYDELSTWGERGQQLAAPYGAEIWADSWSRRLLSLVSKRPALQEEASNIRD